ncbi:hypothetical protein HKD37_11G031448 [Glycine soja]
MTWGLFPRFCLLNPMPVLRMVDKVQGNAAHRMQAKSVAYHIVSSKEQGRTPYGKKVKGFPVWLYRRKRDFGYSCKSNHGIDIKEIALNMILVMKAMYMRKLYMLILYTRLSLK